MRKKTVQGSFLKIYIQLCSIKGWEAAFRGYTIADAFVKQIQAKAKSEGKTNSKDSYEIFKLISNVKQFKEECDKFAKIGDHLAKVVFPKDSHNCNVWKERKHYFDEQNMMVERFRQQFDKL